jgi:hypothetical protein
MNTVVITCVAIWNPPMEFSCCVSCRTQWVQSIAATFDISEITEGIVWQGY